MRKFLLVLAAILLLLGAVQASGQPYGVGIGLSQDYGVVSIYYANGTAVGIAKVEGGPDYKRMMAVQNWTMNYNYTEALLKEAQELASQQSLGARIESWRGQLPLWLGGKPHSPDVTALYGMLRALKAASEAYTSSQTTTATVVFPAYPSRALVKALEAASAQLHLRLPLIPDSPAGLTAAVANGIIRDIRYSGSCEPQRLFLTVEYSRASLNAMLFSEECGVYEPELGIQDTSAGLANWSADTAELILGDLKSIVQLPVERPDKVRLDKISGLVLLGESGTDSRLTDVIRDLFAETGAWHNDAVSWGGGGRNAVDPLFAASIGAAMSHVKQAKEGWFTCSDGWSAPEINHEL